MSIGSATGQLEGIVVWDSVIVARYWTKLVSDRISDNCKLFIAILSSSLPVELLDCLTDSVNEALDSKFLTEEFD